MRDNTEAQLRLGQLRTILIVMFVIFVTILSYTIYWLIDYEKQYGFFEKTKAEVIEQSIEDGITRDILRYNVNGVEYRILADYVSDNEVGDVIKIYYDKNNPIGIIYSLDIKRIAYPLLTALFGVGCISLTIVYILMKKSFKLRHNKSRVMDANLNEEDCISIENIEAENLDKIEHLQSDCPEEEK